MKTTLHANADYEVIDKNPLQIAKGEKVYILAPDRAWPGWVAVQTEGERQAHVPADFLEIQGQIGVLIESFDASDLSVKRGDVVESLREVHGWHWCQNERTKAKGWLAAYLLS